MIKKTTLELKEELKDLRVMLRYEDDEAEHRVLRGKIVCIENELARRYD